MKKYIIIVFFFLFSCKKNSNQTKNVSPIKTDTISLKKTNKKENLIIAVLDTVSINEIKYNSDNKNLPIYTYYQKDIDDLETWSSKMFGNSQGVDLTYAECFNFNITSNVTNKKHPVSNLSDAQYRTAYVFKTTDTVAIHLKINKNYWVFKENSVEPDKILKANDTIMYPIRLSLINGYVKNKDLFYKNGRVKKLEVFVNNKSKGIVKLLDTPLVQEFSINTLFRKDDTITLKPISYYKGTVYDDICISEIQSNLGYNAYPSINKKVVKYHIIGN